MTRLRRIAVFFIPIAALAFIFRDYFGHRFPAHFDTMLQLYPYFVYLTQGGHAMAQEIFSGFPLLVSTTTVLSPFTYPMIFLFGSNALDVVYSAVRIAREYLRRKAKIR